MYNHLVEDMEWDLVADDEANAEFFDFHIKPKGPDKYGNVKKGVVIVLEGRFKKMSSLHKPSYVDFQWG
jgi:hypothetical protein